MKIPFDYTSFHPAGSVVVRTASHCGSLYPTAYGYIAPPEYVEPGTVATVLATEPIEHGKVMVLLSDGRIGWIACCPDYWEKIA